MRDIKIVLVATVIIATVLAPACKTADISSASAANPNAETAPSAAEVQAKSPEGWFVIEDTKYIPVLDELGRQMRDARQSFLNKLSNFAAWHVREGAAFLSRESDKVSGQDREHLFAAVEDLHSLAHGLDKGTVTSLNKLDSIFAEANRADIEHRFLVIDEEAWVPYVEQPDNHFRQARSDFLNKDYKAAAAEIRKGVAFVNLEAARATADGKAALHSSAKELDKLATGIEKGSVKDVKVGDNAIARADYALASAHYLNASESWARKRYDNTGYELNAAAQDLENGASWVGREAEEGAAAAVRDGRLVAGKLIDGSVVWAIDEVGKAIDDVGRGVEGMGKEIEPAKKLIYLSSK
jgi:hypothetical protein